MPELPDLEVIREVLSPLLAGAVIEQAEVRRPIIVRNLLGGEVAERLAGRAITGVGRRGKFLLLPLDDGSTIAVNPMLAGRLRYGDPPRKDRVRDALVIRLRGVLREGGKELRYYDPEDMGKVYLVGDLSTIPGYAEMGPEANDPDLTLDLFRERLLRGKHTGEIKGVLTNQSFVAGIGNAYSDEILWCAGIYPFRRRASLSVEEVERLHHCRVHVLAKAIEVLRERVGDSTDVEVRDFLAVHGKPGQPCPRCGGPISEVRRERRATNFCRHCQPGLMVNKGRRL